MIDNVRKIVSDISTYHSLKGQAMPRFKLSVVSTATLQAELQRRMAKLGGLVSQRDKLNAQIAELESAMGKPAAAAAPGKRHPPRARCRRFSSTPPATANRERST